MNEIFIDSALSFQIFKKSSTQLLTAMLKQSPSRNLRTKGFNVKHGFQVFLLIAVGIWLLYQLKHSYKKKEDSSEKLEIGQETIKLGRKGFQPWAKTEDDLIDDEEGSKLQKMKQGRAAANDETIGNDQDRTEEEETEEVEDLIDEEDKEREEELEEIGLLEYQEQNAEASEKHDKENGASMAATQEKQSSTRKILQLNLKEVSVPIIDEQMRQLLIRM